MEAMVYRKTFIKLGNPKIIIILMENQIIVLAYRTCRGELDSSGRELASEDELVFIRKLKKIPFCTIASR